MMRPSVLNGLRCRLRPLFLLMDGRLVLLTISFLARATLAFLQRRCHKKPYHSNHSDQKPPDDEPHMSLLIITGGLFHPW